MADLVYWPDKRLTERSREIVIYSTMLDDLAKKMTEVMEKEVGIGIAAVQVGEPIRMFVAVTNQHGPIVAVNPSLETWGEEVYEEEGCLSLPDGWGSIPRSSNCRLTASTLDGRSGSLELHGYDARIIQHEYDHLEGHLFSEYLSQAKRTKVFECVRRYKRKGKHDPRRMPDLRGVYREEQAVSLVRPASEEETKRIILP